MASPWRGACSPCSTKAPKPFLEAPSLKVHTSCFPQKTCAGGPEVAQRGACGGEVLPSMPVPLAVCHMPGPRGPGQIKTQVLINQTPAGEPEGCPTPAPPAPGRARPLGRLSPSPVTVPSGCRRLCLWRAGRDVRGGRPEPGDFFQWGWIMVGADSGSDGVREASTLAWGITVAGTPRWITGTVGRFKFSLAACQ
jgi:hypothetical protein